MEAVGCDDDRQIRGGSQEPGSSGEVDPTSGSWAQRHVEVVHSAVAQQAAGAVLDRPRSQIVEAKVEPLDDELCGDGLHPIRACRAHASPRFRELASTGSDQMGRGLGAPSTGSVPFLLPALQPSGGVGALRRVWAFGHPGFDENHACEAGVAAFPPVGRSR